ncbi:Uncharacterised protein [Bordetella pertussis]|nr:Uncharacterised protein [Bordetella pertussis]CPN40303.1 Uncharacterised protein [Bordetella pertussis]
MRLISRSELEPLVAATRRPLTDSMVCRFESLRTSSFCGLT